MRGSTVRRLQQAVSRLRYRFTSPALILMYHRVTELSTDPYQLAVTPDRFAEQMEVVRRYGFPTRLERLAAGLRDGKVRHRTIVVTLDDGYADNLYNAKPLFERFEIPATVFVATAQVGCPQEFWWDELERLLLQPGALPAQLELTIGARGWRWELGDGATYTDADFEHHRDWHIERDDAPTARHRLHRSLYDLMHNLPSVDQQHVLSSLRSWAGAQPDGRPTHRTLSHNELRGLVQGDLIEVGAHSMTHAPLATLSAAAQREEIRASRARIEEIVNRPVSSFAYPHGSYTQETLTIVDNEGFALACSSDTAVVRRGTDRFRLPRMSMRNWDGDTFSEWLTGWLSA